MPKPKKTEMVEIPRDWIKRLKLYCNAVNVYEDRVEESFAIDRILEYLDSLDSLIDD